MECFCHMSNHKQLYVVFLKMNTKRIHFYIQHIVILQKNRSQITDNPCLRSQWEFSYLINFTSEAGLYNCSAVEKRPEDMLHVMAPLLCRRPVRYVLMQRI